MEKFNPFDEKGKVKDEDLARKAAEAQDEWMDKSKTTVHGFFTKKGEQGYRKKMGEQEAEKTLITEIRSKEMENYEKMAWDSFLQATEIRFEACIHSIPPIVKDSRIIVESGGDEFKLRLQDLIEKGLINAEQIIELFEIKIENGEVRFTGKMKEDWKKRLEEILNKRVLS